MRQRNRKPLENSLGPSTVTLWGFPDSSVSKESTRNAGRAPGEGNGNPLQYSCLENSMDRGTWQATVCATTKSWTQLSLYPLAALIHLPNFEAK